MQNSKIGTYVLFILIAIGAIAFIMALQVDEDMVDTYGYADPILYISYIFSVIGALLWIGSTASSMIAKPETIKGQLIGVGFLAVVVLISYVLADASDAAQYANASEGEVLMSDMLLYATYILSALAVISWAYGSVVKMIK